MTSLPCHHAPWQISSGLGCQRRSTGRSSPPRGLGRGVLAPDAPYCTVCIEAGRKTLTHTSWIGLTPASRKWMSGQAAALAATQDRTQFANFSASHPLRDPALPSVRRPPSPLDFYLSWMSPNFLPSEPIPAVWNFIRSSL